MSCPLQEAEKYRPGRENNKGKGRGPEHGERRGAFADRTCWGESSLEETASNRTVLKHQDKKPEGSGARKGAWPHQRMYGDDSSEHRLGGGWLAPGEG